MTSLYLAGPMRGYRYYNFSTFLQAAEDLRRDGLEVVSPAELDLAEGFNPTLSMEAQGFSRDEAMRRDIQALLTVHAVGFLPGSGASPGARAEFVVAQALGLVVGTVDPYWSAAGVRWGLHPASYAQLEYWLDEDALAAPAV